MVYDYQNNLFYSFKHSTPEAKLEAFTISNFKKGDASSGFAKDFLGKRVAAIKGAVYGDDTSALAAKQAPHKLNLIQRIMKNVTTPVLISHRQAEADASSHGKKAELVKYQRLLILQ